MANKNIEDKVEELLKEDINNLGYEIYDVIFEKEAKDFYLRIIIDSEKGISIDDCEKVSNQINSKLDKADYIKEQYFLEVSSPGIERNLRKEKHFIDSIDKKIIVKLYNKAENGKKEIEGFLREYNNEFLIIETEENKIKIDKKNIALAKTIFNW
ncbi:MAG: ribosome maturation factor RimP [Candidatus Scatovivens sp.]